MSTSTFLELAQRLRLEVGVTGSGPASVTGQSGMLQKLVNWIADADVEIQSRHQDWEFLWSEFSGNTIASTKDITKPSDFGYWIADTFFVDYTTDDYVHLDQMTYKDWKLYYGPGTQDESSPTHFVVKPNDNIILHPVPDGVYALTAEYYKAPTRMTANTSTSDIPERFVRAIITRAKIYYAEHENAPEIMAEASREFMELLGQLEASYLPGQDARTLGHSDMRVMVE